MVKKARNDPKTREIVRDVQMYEGLTEHAGWRHLKKKIEERQDRLLSILMRRIRRGEEVKQREIDYQNGFFDGALFVLSRPEVAERNLELAASAAFAMFEEAAEATEEGMSPYA